MKYLAEMSQGDSQHFVRNTQQAISQVFRD